MVILTFKLKSVFWKNNEIIILKYATSLPQQMREIIERERL